MSHARTMKLTSAPLVLAMLSAGSMTAWAQGGTCGSCPSVGFCPPTFPMGVGLGEDHRCEDHSGADLFAAFLINANLASADLTIAILFGADLTGANLSNANLFSTDLFSADLFGANLTNADLTFADLTFANLTGANLTGANLIFANLSGADLTNAIGLGLTTGGAQYDCSTVFTGTGFDPVAAGWINFSSLCGVCVTATETIRLGTPPNPNAFLPGQTSGPILGQTWDPVVDHASFMPGATVDFMLISAASIDVLVPPHGSLLCLPPFLLPLPLTAVGVPFALPLPTNCNLIGVSIVTQGMSSDGISLLLTNALDITFGTL